MLKSMIDLPKISGSRSIGTDSRLPKSRWNRDSGQVSGKKTFTVLYGLLFFSLIILIATIIPVCLYAQVTFERIYDGAGYSVQQTTDEGYITISPLIKTDSLGNVLWTKPLGGQSVQQTTDEGYIIIGKTMSTSGRDLNIRLIKTDSLGNAIWTRIYDAGWQEWGNSVKQTTDGGYILAGRYNTFGLIKTDSQGNIIWTNSYNCGYYAEAHSVQQTTDGGYIAAGEVIIDNIDQQFYLVKTDSLGDTLWTTISGSSSMAEIAFSVQQTTDGGYIAAGIKIGFMGSCNPYLVKTDSFGNILWTRIHSFGGNNNESHSIQQTTDGGYIYTGFTNSSESRGDVLLVKIDSQGNVLWSMSCGKTGIRDNAFSVQQTTDEGYIIVGYTDYEAYTPHSVYLIKTDSQGFFTPAVYVSVPEITYGALGDTITIPVNTEEITSVGVFSAEFVLTFNSAVISGIDIDTSGTLVSGTDWLCEYNVVGGEFSVNMSGSDELVANGTLINLRFVVVSDTVSGGVSPLHFESFLFNQGSPEAVTHDGVFIALGTGIEGTVTEAGKSPIEGAVVNAFNDEFTYCDTTDAVGHYFIPEVAPGTYAMTVNVFGYNAVDTTGIVVVSGETTVVNFAMPHPEIAVVPATFDVTISVHSTLDTVLHITNNGNGPLEFMIRTTDGSGGGIPGAIIESHPSVGSPTGFEWDGTYFWQGNTDREVVKLDSNFNVIATYPGLGWISALAWHDGYLYQADYTWSSSAIYKIDVQTGYEPVDTIDIQHARGFEWVGDHIWFSNGYYQTSTIYECDSLGNIINSWSGPAGGMRGISYNPYLDSLYICPGVWWDTIYSIDPHTGNFNPAFTTPGSHPSYDDKCVGSSFDSRYPEYIWITHQYDNMIYLVDTGNEVVGWLPVEPVSGSVGSGETFPVTVHFDSHGLTPNSTYTASILIHNNSSDSLVNIPVTMHISTVGIEDEETTSIPKVFALNQNYPNPFSTPGGKDRNPQTTISYSLPKSCKVSLKIYNIKGQLVETLVDDVQLPGYHSVVWNVEDASSGIYFYRITAGDFTDTKKCVILK